MLTSSVAENQPLAQPTLSAEMLSNVLVPKICLRSSESRLFMWCPLFGRLFLLVNPPGSAFSRLNIYKV